MTKLEFIKTIQDNQTTHDIFLTTITGIKGQCYFKNDIFWMNNTNQTTFFITPDDNDPEFDPYTFFIDQIESVEMKKKLISSHFIPDFHQLKEQFFKDVDLRLNVCN